MMAWFVSLINPWFLRSFSYTDGSGAGVFSVYFEYGWTRGWFSFRVVQIYYDFFLI